MSSEEPKNLTDFKNLYEEQLEKNKELQQQIVQLSKLSQMGKLLAATTHELKNPLAIISAVVDSFEDSDDFTSPQGQRFIKAIKKSSDRMTKIVSGMQQHARQGNKPIDVQFFQLERAIKSTIEFIQPIFKKSNTTLKLEYCSRDAVIRGNEGNFQQIIVNLLTNAKDAIGERQGEISVKIREEKERILIEIMDSGEGISQDNIDKLFQDFYTTKPVGKGTGLGLSIVCSFVKDLGGKIEVKSDHGVGSNFTVVIPVQSWIGEKVEELDLSA